MKLSSLFLAILFCTALFTACSGEELLSYAPENVGQDALYSAQQVSHNLTQTPESYSMQEGDFVKLSEPNENAFTIEIPKGWKSQLGVLRKGSDGPRPFATCISPDGGSMIFTADPYVPYFTLPNSQLGMMMRQMGSAHTIAMMDYIPADRFGRDYVQKRFGKYNSFQLGQTEVIPEYRQYLENTFRQQGMRTQITVAAILFEYMADGKKNSGIIRVACIKMDGMWMTDISGFITDADPQKMPPLYAKVVQSYQPNPQWQQRENQRNRQRQTNMTRDHYERMEGLRAAGRANTERWEGQQRTNDRSHNNFMDYIRGENTVSSGTQTGKVDAGYNHYYVNPNNGSYIGTDIQENPDPSNYQYWKKQ